MIKRFISSLRQRSRSPQLQEAWIPILIAAVSVLTAVAGGFAADAAGQASTARHLQLQDALQVRAREAELDSSVDQYLALFPRFEAHMNACALLNARARKARRSNSSLADALELRAQGEMALARSLRRYFPEPEEVGWGCLQSDLIARDASALRSTALETDTEYKQLVRAERKSDSRARAERTRVNALVAATAVMFLSLLFLTVARIPYHRTGIPFLVLGLVAAIGGFAWFGWSLAS